MRERLPAFTFALALAAALATAQAEERPFFLRDGDRVVFYGDSITDQRLYTTFVESFVRTRFPRRRVDFVHSGWGGDRVSGGGGGPVDVRLQRDVIAHAPTVVTIMLGMNDGAYRPFDEEVFKRYAAGYEHVVATLKKKLPGVRIVAIRPSPYDDVTRKPGIAGGGYNKVLERYGAFVQDLAAREGLLCADLNAPVCEALARAQARDSALAQKLIPDRVHPGPAGHLLLAQALLHAWNAPSAVASVRIDAREGRHDAAGALVEDLRTGGKVSWTQLDEALPFPLDLQDRTTALAVAASGFQEALDREPLVVAGLAPGRWLLRIDGETVASHPSEEWARGVDLAGLPTPMALQAAQVHALTVRHVGLRWTRWRQVQLPLADENPELVEKALAALDAVDADMVSRQREAATPRRRRFELLRLY